MATLARPLLPAILAFGAATALIAALAVVPLPAQAQAQLPEPGFSWGVGESVEHDSNLDRLPSNSPAGTQIADTIKSTSILGSFDDTYSRETITAKAQIGRVDYVRRANPDDHTYDYTSEDLHAALDSSLPYNIDATIKAARTAALAHFADIGEPVRDVIDTKDLTANLALPITIDFRTLLGADRVQTRNSYGPLQTQDLDTTEVNGGIRYQPASGNSIDLLLRTVRGIYINGTPSALISPGYRDKAVDLRADWTFTGASRLQGRAGFIRRSNDELIYVDPANGQANELNRNFSGPQYDLTYLWQITAASRITFFALRATGAAGDNNYLSAVSKTLRITPAYQLTTKVEIDAYVEWTRRNYFSNVLAALSLVEGAPPGVTTRIDTNHNFGLSVNWTPRRWLQLFVDVHRENRDSNQAQLTYDNNVETVGIQGNF
jgi:hypothetical protein